MDKRGKGEGMKERKGKEIKGRRERKKQGKNEWWEERRKEIKTAVGREKGRKEAHMLPPAETNASVPFLGVKNLYREEP